MKREQSNSSMRNINGVKWLAAMLSFVVYVAIVIYMEYHFYNLISQFLGDAASVFGMVVVGASAITALALPMGLHFWFRSGKQKVVAYVFYGVHFLIMFTNMILDSNMTKNAVDVVLEIGKGATPETVTAALAAATKATQVTGFMGIYETWILPGYIAFYGLAWALLWMLDDGSEAIDREREVVAEEQASIRERRLLLVKAKGTAISSAFESPVAKQKINEWAARMGPELLAAEMGLTMQELGVGEGDQFRFWNSGEGDALPSPSLSIDDEFDALRPSAPPPAPSADSDGLYAAIAPRLDPQPVAAVPGDNHQGDNNHRADDQRFQGGGL